MELYKTEYTRNRGKGKLDKVLLKYEEVNNNNLKDILYVSDKYDIVIKFNYLELINNDYKMNEALKDLPNFIKYLYKLNITEWSNIKEITNSFTKTNYYNGVEVGISVMNHYTLGCIYNYEWNENNFYILKNVIKQVVLAIFYAYDTIGFIHEDLHCGNVLLKTKSKDYIEYGKKKVKIEEYEAVIMDYDNSKINEKDKLHMLMRKINRFITSIMCSNNMKLYITYEYDRLIKLASKNEEKEINYYDELEEIADNIKIENN